MSSRRTGTAVLLAGLTLALSGCGRALPTAADLGGGSSNAAAVAALSPTTAPPTRGVRRAVVWATYRMVQTLDPVQAFDYPEDTVDDALCDSVLRQAPDGSIGPGLATATYATPLKLVLTLRDGPRFWDGKPVTAADVAYDLNRAASTTSGSFYPSSFVNVTSIRAVAPGEVVITLRKPNYWITGELSEMPGVIYEAAYARREGKKLGTPQGLTMCSGPYEVRRWIPGQSLTAVANPHYWDSTLQPKVHEIVFKGIGDDASITSGFETGAIQGSYTLSLETIDQLKRDRQLTVSDGPSIAVDAMVLDNLKGVLADVRVRRALSLAIDRSAYIAAVYHGAAQLPRTLESPGEWGFGRSVFQAAWDRLPVPRVDLPAARSLIREAGAEGKSITIGTTESLSNLATAANLVRQAATEIGLRARIKSVSSADYIDFFTDASARKGIDMFPTSDYGDYPDPAAYFYTVVTPGGSQNFDGFDDPTIDRLLASARASADPDQRASLEARAAALVSQQLPWIPLADPDTTLVTSHALTGAPDSFVYMGGPWANMLGGRG